MSTLLSYIFYCACKECGSPDPCFAWAIWCHGVGHKGRRMLMGRWWPAHEERNPWAHAPGTRRLEQLRASSGGDPGGGRQETGPVSFCCSHSGPPVEGLAHGPVCSLDNPARGKTWRPGVRDTSPGSLPPVRRETLGPCSPGLKRLRNSKDRVLAKFAEGHETFSGLVGEVLAGLLPSPEVG